MRSISNRTALLAKSPLELIQIMSYPNLSALLEAIVYLAKEPVSLDDIHAAVPEVDAIEIERTLNELIERYRTEHHGIEIREVAGGYRLRLWKHLPSSPTSNL